MTVKGQNPPGYTYVFGVSHINGTCIYTVRLNWEETESGKSKMAAYTHDMRKTKLPDKNESDTVLKPCLRTSTRSLNNVWTWN